MVGSSCGKKSLGAIEMKKSIIITTVLIIVLLIVGYISYDHMFPKVKILSTNATLNYYYDEKNISINLSADESKTIKRIFEGRRLINDCPSCGFKENISISFDDMIFCVACDNCPVIKIGKKYINISESDRKIINSIFEKHGGTFPCL